MVAYGIGVLTLIKRLKAVCPGITQPWYARNSGSLGMFNNVELYFNSLKRNSPSRGYFPNPTKTILTVNPDNIKAGILFGAQQGFKVFTSARYISGYITDKKYKRDWFKYQMEKWERDICAVTKIAGTYI